MNEQARRVRNEAIPQLAEGPYYNKSIFDKAVVDCDDEAVYFETRGKDSGIVRLTFDMLETLKELVEEQQ